MYAAAIINDAIKPLKRLSIVYCGMKYAIAYKIPKFITRLNNPKVTKLIGKVIILIIGLINMLIIVSIAAISMAYQKLSTLIPGR